MKRKRFLKLFSPILYRAFAYLAMNCLSVDPFVGNVVGHVAAYFVADSYHQNSDDGDGVVVVQNFG